MTTKTTKAWLVAGILALAAWRGVAAQAANPAHLNIDVTIAANLSVAVNGAQSSTMTATWNLTTPNFLAVGNSSATVLNDSGAQTEKWALSTIGGSMNLSGNPENWALDTTTDTLPGADQFAVQAVFGSSMTVIAGCPAGGDGNWDQPHAEELTTAPAQYTSTRFADPALNFDGTHEPDVAAGAPDGQMFAGNQRALCWRLIMPASTATLDPQNVQVIITAQNP